LIDKRSNYTIALGGNLPQGEVTPAETLIGAISALATEGVLIRSISRFFATPCFPAGAGPDFVNAAIIAESGLAPDDMLALLHRIEARFHRERLQRWGARTLDLDLIACGGAVLPDAETQRHWMELAPSLRGEAAPDRLILPHPRLHERAFVLVPLADICPEWVHPVLGLTAREMLSGLPIGEIAAIRPI